MRTRTLRLLLVSIGIIVFLQSCAPVFSELQSARTVGKNNFEETPSASTVFYSLGEGLESVQRHFGLQGAYGLWSRVDLRIRYEYISLPRDDGGIGVIGIGSKFSLVEDKIAFHLPIGKAIGEGTGKPGKCTRRVCSRFP